jgi:hypothetical protein
MFDDNCSIDKIVLGSEQNMTGVKSDCTPENIALIAPAAVIFIVLLSAVIFLSIKVLSNNQAFKSFQAGMPFGSQNYEEDAYMDLDNTK